MSPIWRAVLTTLLDLAAVALVVTGVALIYVPAAFIVAGAALIAVSYRLAANTESGTPA
jgi:hypothetical protein